MKRLFAALLAVLIVFGFCFHASADVTDDISGDYGEFFDSAAGEFEGLLPDGADGDDPTADAEALTNWRYIFSAVGEVLGITLSKIIPMFCTLCGLLLLSAAVAAFRTAIAEKFAKILEFACTCAIAACTVALQYDTLAGAAEYINELGRLANMLFPLTVSLYAAGGNVAAASVSSGAYGIFLAIAENVLAKTVIPFASICTAFALSGSALTGVDLRAITGAIKKTYTTALGFIMMLFCAVTAAQSAIASGQDSLGLRAAKFFAGSAIPIVGGSVSESMRTLAASIGMLRKSIGISGIVMIFLLFLPTLTSLLLTRTACSLAAGLGAMLGCDRESALLTELASVYGYISAVLAGVSLMLIFMLTLLVGTAAIGN